MTDMRADERLLGLAGRGASDTGWHKALVVRKQS